MATMLSSLALEMPSVSASAVSRLHQRHPFELHWRREPPEWIGNLPKAYDYQYRMMLASCKDPCCLQCGAVPCPYDHDQDRQVRLADLQFVRELVEHRKKLMAQLETVCLRDICDCVHIIFSTRL